MPFAENLQSLLGLLVLTLLAILLAPRASSQIWSDTLKTVVAGLAVQFVIALVILKLPPVRFVFAALNDAVGALQIATEAGTSFVFGYLGGGPLPFKETHPGSSFIFAFRALPMILVMSAISALLQYWKIIPWIVRGFAWAVQKSLSVGGPVGFGVAANIFVGMVESPLLIRPYIAKLTRSELFTIMTCGMATIAGTVIVLYASTLAPVVPDALGHLLAASIISVPAAVMVARLMMPETALPTEGDIGVEDLPDSAMEAVTRGTLDGVTLLINVIAMLIVLVTLVHLINMALGGLPNLYDKPITLQLMLGYALAPIAWLMGIPWSEAVAGGGLLGIKIVLNEFLAFLELTALPKDTLSPRSTLIMTYALTGFANFASLGIMIGGLVTIAPSRRTEIVQLGIRSIVAATIATCMTGAIVGLLTV